MMKKGKLEDGKEEDENGKYDKNEEKVKYN